MQIYCIFTQGYIHPAIGAMLLNAAHDLMEGRSRKKRLKVPEYELTGEIKTSYKYGSIGTVGGIVFKATFDSILGSATTEFIVTPKDRPAIEKLYFGPVPLKAIGYTGPVNPSLN